MQLTDVDRLDSVARYMWNIKLCESLTPVLNTAEILLKNAIHRCMTKLHGVPTWFDNGLQLKSSELVLLKRTYRDVMAKGKYGPDDIVAELSLKFWVNMLRACYAKDVWKPLSTQEFMPNRPAHITRNDVETIFNNMRAIRNRAYHHEPIWHLPNLQKAHSEALLAINWLSSRHHVCVKAMDTFPEIYAQGIAPWRHKMEIELFGSVLPPGTTLQES